MLYFKYIAFLCLECFLLLSIFTIFVIESWLLNFCTFFYVIQIFGTPKDHRKSKPYHDHVFVFSIADDHIWFRNYQVRDVVQLNH